MFQLYATNRPIIRLVKCTYRCRGRAERHKNPIACLDQLCNTRDLREKGRDFDSSSLLLRDSRRDSLHPAVHLQQVREVNPRTTPDTSFHSQSYSMFPCTRVPMESVCILNAANIYDSQNPLHAMQSITIVGFTSLAVFKRSIRTVDFSEFLKCNDV